MAEQIVRIAARGDGVTASGKHVAFGVPGDTLLDDGTLVIGPHHQVTAMPSLSRNAAGASSSTSMTRPIGSIWFRGSRRHSRSMTSRPKSAQPHLSPPKSRRRASLRALRVGKGAVVGFNAAKSHRIVDMLEDHILRPELFDLVAPLRTLLGEILRRKKTGEVQLTLVDQGVDLLLKGIEPEGYEAMEALTAFCERNRLARLSIDQGLGPETLYEPVPATITLSGVQVGFPVNGFLQATEDGEAELVASMREAIAEPARTADLFAGLGTFALALPGKVYAAEASRDAVLALKRAAPTIAAEHRDLYRRPLDESELKAFDAVVLDPPRAGAEQQTAALASSPVERIAYVSCNPATFARDARLLADGGYKLEWLRPVGQFRWSTHVELAAAFVRQ